MLFLDWKNGAEQNVVMWHYLAWPDIGTPTDPWTLVEIIHSLKEMEPNCTIVHCSNGAGRTGIFIALKQLIDKILSKAETLNIFQTVLDLRKDRKFMVKIHILLKVMVNYEFLNPFFQVMKQDQYRFLYSAVAIYIRLIEEGIND